VKSDIAIAQTAPKWPIARVARRLGLGLNDLLLYGHYKAKVSLDSIHKLGTRPAGKLILMTEGITSALTYR
jgi:formate--tetrahydrofolate ligase